LDNKFTFKIFSEKITAKNNWKIKQTLLDQTVIAGIGNIYADESLWRANIHPKTLVRSLSTSSKRKLYMAIRQTLAHGIELGGDSMSDYRNIHGEKGGFQEKHCVYRRKGLKCLKKGCGGIIARIVVAGRGTHFCPKHQK
jgi:formamidopyrimidine-DNA glycosylase